MKPVRWYVNDIAWNQEDSHRTGKLADVIERWGALELAMVRMQRGINAKRVRLWWQEHNLFDPMQNDVEIMTDVVMSCCCSTGACQPDLRGITVATQRKECM